MKLLLLVILFPFLILPTAAQPGYAIADSMAMRARGDDVTQVHRQLTGGLSDDELKIRAFYYFITHHVGYDMHEAQRADKLPVKQEPSRVLRSGKAICHGYSALFMEFCRLSEIPCHLVSGFAKPGGVLSREGHTWNMVKINGAWKPVDATWGSGVVNSQGRYTRVFTNDYFLPEPEQFLNDHYPFDPMWQLVSFPVALHEYKKVSWSMNTRPENFFNFNDTIAGWEKADSTTRNYFSAHRMVRFNLGEPVIKEELAYATFMMGNREFKKANRIIEQLFPPKAGPGDQNQTGDLQERMNMIDSADFHYREAMKYYDQVQLKNFSGQAVLQNNIKGLRQNRDALKRSREMIHGRQ